MKGYHWLVLLGLAFSLGCGATRSVKPEAEATASFPDQDLVPAKIVGVVNHATVELNIPKNHKLLVYACAYRDGIYDPKLSRGCEVLEFKKDPYVARVSAGIIDPGKVTGVPTDQRRLFATVAVSAHPASAPVHIKASSSTTLLNELIDIRDGKQPGSCTLQFQAVIAEPTFWFGIAYGTGHATIWRRDVGIDSRNPLVVNFYYQIERMTQEEIEKKTAGSLRDMSQVPKGLQAELRTPYPLYVETQGIRSK